MVLRHPTSNYGNIVTSFVMVASDAAADGFILAASVVALAFAVFQYIFVAKVRRRQR